MEPMVWLIFAFILVPAFVLCLNCSAQLREACEARAVWYL
jgi:hypothetical protein